MFSLTVHSNFNYTILVVFSNVFTSKSNNCQYQSAIMKIHCEGGINLHNALNITHDESVLSAQTQVQE